MQAIVACATRAHRREYRVELEVDAGVGVADIVLAKRAPRSTEGLRALGRIPPRLAVLLSRDVGVSITSRHAMAVSLGASESGTQRVISKLSLAGLVKQTGNNLDLCTIKTPPFERLIAVEAKICDWRRVLVQAYRNLQFADESWVVLDHTYIRPAIAQIHRFQLAGVGLASMDRHGNLFIHHEATTQGPVSQGKRWQAQAVLASRVLTRMTVERNDC